MGVLEPGNIFPINGPVRPATDAQEIGGRVGLVSRSWLVSSAELTRKESVWYPFYTVIYYLYAVYGNHQGNENVPLLTPTSHMSRVP